MTDTESTLMILDPSLTGCVTVLEYDEYFEAFQKLDQLSCLNVRNYLRHFWMVLSPNMRYQCERYFGDEGDNASDELGDILAKISGEMSSAATASFGMTVSAAAHSRLQQQAEHLKLTSAAILSNKFLLASRILSFAFDDNVLFYIAVQLLNECSPQSLELLGLKPAVQDVIPTYS